MWILRGSLQEWCVKTEIFQVLFQRCVVHRMAPLPFPCTANLPALVKPHLTAAAALFSWSVNNPPLAQSILNRVGSLKGTHPIRSVCAMGVESKAPGVLLVVFNVEIFMTEK